MQFLNLKQSLVERGFLKGFIELPKDRAHWAITLLLILFAYALSVWVRLEWIDFAQANYQDSNGSIQYLRPDMVKNGVALPNTHDSFYFGSILQKGHLGLHENNHLIPSVYKNGMITYLPYILLKLFPSLDIELLLLWLPVFVSGIVCIPIVLIGRLYGSSLWGFFAACLAGITHSYYNRTLAGYYDTDMFSITVPAFALYFLLRASRRCSVHYALFGAISLYVYNFFYASSQAVTASLAVAFVFYRLILFLLDLILYQNGKKEKVILSKSSAFTFKSILLVAFATYAESWSGGAMIEVSVDQFLYGLFILLILWFVLSGIILEGETNLFRCFLNRENPFKIPIYILPLCALTMFVFVAAFGGVEGKIFSKLQSYVSAGEGNSAKVSSQAKGYNLHYLDVVSTVREASEIPPDVVRNRILADAPSCSCPRCLPQDQKNNAWIIPSSLIGFFGLFLLILRYWELCLTIPFLAIAYYCFKGAVGLRFTVHVGNVSSIGLVFLIMVLIWGLIRIFFASKKKSLPQMPEIGKWCSWLLSAGLVCFFALPNIQHAKNYNSHVVYPVKTIEVLNKLNEVSDQDDFVVTWWDYGSGCWFYGNTRTFTSPAHQTFDNFLTSEILRSTNPSRASHLARVKTETFIDLQNKRKLGEPTFGTAVEAIFKDGTSELAFYQGLLEDIGNEQYPLPTKTSDNFLFLPYEILRIFPTILSFSSRNLYFPRKYRLNQSGAKDPPMIILKNGRREGASLVFDGGYRIDRRGMLRFEGNQSGMIPYAQILEVSDNNQSAKPVNMLTVDGLRIPSNSDPVAARRLLYIRKYRELVILSPETYRSTFAKRFLLDQFDQRAYEHPLFDKGPFPRQQPYMAQADWVTQSGQNLILNMRGGYKITANISSNKATIPGISEQVPFSFHRSMHQTDGKLIKFPSSGGTDSRFHLIQTNLPVFLGGRTYEVPNGGQSLQEVAKQNDINPNALVVSTGKNLDSKFEGSEKIEIPAKGYVLRPAFFFMDNELFKSTLIQGFLMENLDPVFFEKIYSSPWGKVYKFLK